MGRRYVAPKAKRRETRSRGKFYVNVYCLEAAIVERTLDGGVGGLKDRRAAARVAFYWLHDNGHASRPEATRLAAKMEDGGENVTVKTGGRTLRLSIVEGR